MYEINIAIDKVIPQSLRSKVRGYYRICIALTGSVLLVYIVMAAKLSTRIGALKKSEAQVYSSMQSVINKYDINSWSQEWTDFYNEMSMIKNAYSERTNLTVRLYAIYTMLPKRMSIESIVMSKDGSYMTLKLVALAEEQEEYNEVKKFITNFNSNMHFGKGAKLVSQERTQINNKIVSVMGIKVFLKNKNNG